ncbi:30S ribosomal protein S20 [Anaerofustis sp.]|uniref:30S ribosomal protein S20 n=1 Tax=Anaerofustis sp. TaxID=1872517 RepID=UPI0025B8EAED|nr:30S ribosomal protein S20 [Anaerofustis sp.]
MANIKSAKKRAITNEKSRLRNKAIKTNLKTVEKDFEQAVLSNDVEKANEACKLASKKFDMAASKGVIHKNAANRKKAQLAKKVNALG